MIRKHLDRDLNWGGTRAESNLKSLGRQGSTNSFGIWKMPQKQDLSDNFDQFGDVKTVESSRLCGLSTTRLGPKAADLLIGSNVQPCSWNCCNWFDDLFLHFRHCSWTEASLKSPNPHEHLPNACRWTILSVTDRVFTEYSLAHYLLYILLYVTCYSYEFSLTVMKTWTKQSNQTKCELQLQRMQHLCFNKSWTCCLCWAYLESMLSEL